MSAVLLADDVTGAGVIDDGIAVVTSGLTVASGVLALDGAKQAAEGFYEIASSIHLAFSAKGGNSSLDDAINNGNKLEKHKVYNNSEKVPLKGEPNSSADLLNPDGSVKQRRFYDDLGRAKQDIDFNHTDDGTHTFPHIHNWHWTNGIPKRLK